jgi:hypothetical protein
MKRIVLIGILLFMAAGCAPFKDAYYLDQEFGKDSRASWDAQIVNRDPAHLNSVPEGMTGISAEEVMSVRNQMYAERPRKSQSSEFELGGGKK